MNDVIKLDNTVYFTALNPVPACLPGPHHLLQSVIVNVVIPFWLQHSETWTVFSACVSKRRETNFISIDSQIISTSTKVCTRQVFFSLVKYCVPIRVAARSKAWTVFARSNSGIVGSNSTQGVKQSFSGPSPAGLMTAFYCLRFQTLPPNLEAQVPVLISPQVQGGPVVPPDTGFPFRRLLRLAELRWSYSNPPPHGILN
jgi:hypothetical protein